MKYTELRKSDEYLAARGSASMPSVEEWLKSGGEIEYVPDAPRPEFTIGAFNNSRSCQPSRKP